MWVAKLIEFAVNAAGTLAVGNALAIGSIKGANFIFGAVVIVVLVSVVAGFSGRRVEDSIAARGRGAVYVAGGRFSGIAVVITVATFGEQFCPAVAAHGELATAADPSNAWGRS